MSSQKISLSKIKAILKYFGTYTNPQLLGKVKLMKLFYFLDFTHVKKYGVPVTMDTYYKLEHGPIPSMIKNLVDAVEEDAEMSILSDTIQIKNEESSSIHQVVCLQEFKEEDKDRFTNSEILVLEEICKSFKDKTAGYLEQLSHNEAPWRESTLMSKIPYSMALLDNDCKVSKEDIELMMMLIN